MQDFVLYDADDAVEASIPKLSVNIRNVESIDVSEERDMNAGHTYYFIDFLKTNGSIQQWKFYYQEKRDIAYNNLQLKMSRLSAKGSTVNTAPAGYLIGIVDGVNREFTTSIPFEAGSTKVWWNGQFQYQVRDYNEDVSDPEHTKIIFIVAPEAGTSILCDFKPKQ